MDRRLCFSKAVVDFLTYDLVKSKVCLDDIPICDIKVKLRKVITIIMGLNDKELSF